MSETKGYAIQLRPYGTDVTGYVVDVSAAKAKSQVVRSLATVKFDDVSSCRRVRELDGRPITNHSWAAIEQVPYE